MNGKDGLVCNIRLSGTNKGFEPDIGCRETQTNGIQNNLERTKSSHPRYSCEG